jgi:UDP-N-acetylmuramyl pentapeptide phosphotransferase/UDP-N-acetylglucosamine-1-phosphate transferase
MAEETHHPDDEQLSQDEKLKKVSSAARLFDVRRVIGGLFVVYGVIVTLIGFFDDQSEIDKAQGVRINLWMGLAMLALGLLFLLWLRLNPPKAPDLSPETAADGGPEASAEN